MTSPVVSAEERLESLLFRRSVSPKRLKAPGPSADELDGLIQAGLRAPDHGGLHPWRIVEFGAENRESLAQCFEQEKKRRDPLATPLDIKRAREHAMRAPMLLGFVVSPQRRSLIPVREQWLGAGAALGNILNAAHQLGYGAIMLSGERCFDDFLRQQLGLADDECLAGFVSLGTTTHEPPSRKPAPSRSLWTRWPGPVKALQAGEYGRRLPFPPPPTAANPVENSHASPVKPVDPRQKGFFSDAAGASIATQIKRREQAERMATSALSEADRLEKELAHLQHHSRVLSRELEAAETQLRQRDWAKETPLSPAAQLRGRKILYVGGRPSSTPIIRGFVTRHGGIFHRHDAGLDIQRAGRLAEAVATADLVLFPADCLDDEAADTLKELCISQATAFVEMRNATMTSFVAALSEHAREMAFGVLRDGNLQR